jgi:hypothetical protein
MSSFNQEQLAEYAKKLKEYNRQAIEAFLKWDIEALAIIVSDYTSLKKSIRISDIDFHIINIADKEVKHIYERLYSGKLEIDQIIKPIDTEEPIEGLNDDEIENLSDLLYNKFSHYEYVRNLYEINFLILRTRVPRNLENYVAEARYCYAYEQYNAVYSLSRTILEISIKHIYAHKHNKSLKDIAEERKPISHLINDLCNNLTELNKKIRAIYYDETSDLIHWGRVVGRLEAKEMFHDTLDVVQKLFSKYEPTLLAPKPLIFRSS